MADIEVFEYESSNTFTTLFLHLVETVLWLSFFFHPNSVQGEEICTLSYFSCISSHYFHSKDEFSWRFYENKLLSWISYSVKSFVSIFFLRFSNFERVKRNKSRLNAMSHIRFHRKSFTKKLIIQHWGLLLQTHDSCGMNSCLLIRNYVACVPKLILRLSTQVWNLETNS